LLIRFLSPIGVRPIAGLGHGAQNVSGGGCEVGFELALEGLDDAIEGQSDVFVKRGHSCADYKGAGIRRYEGARVRLPADATGSEGG
jgi:hypothetical protein